MKVFDYAKVQLDLWFEAQFKKGLAKYGTPLYTFNGRDAFEDAMQESVDGLMYLNQLRLERNRVCRLLLTGEEPTTEEREYIEKYGKTN